MLKAGIVYADAVTTVSPTYAKEICTPEYGFGLDGLLRAHQAKLTGILNGIDTRYGTRPPMRICPRITRPGASTRAKPRNKRALLQRFLGPIDDAQLSTPVLGLVGRLVEQKGVDWVLAVIPVLLAETDVRVVLLGSGQTVYEQKLARLAKKHPERVLIEIGYDEPLAHLIEAGSDIFLMPSRFEPCGLNQMYSLRYGTPPVVFKTGGLADTVVNVSEATLADGSANGFVFERPSAVAFIGAIRRALKLLRQPVLWRRVQQTGMRQSFGWEQSARHYLSLYSAKGSS